MLLIPYGASSLDADQVAARRGDVRCPTPYTLIEEVDRRVLRLNGAQYAFPEPPDLRAMSDATVQLDYLRDHLKGFCDLWNKPPKLFLDRYFDFVTAQVEQRKEPLSRLLEKFGGLYCYRDWTLSAPRPLPRAWIRADGEFYPVDFAFWLGDRLLAVILAGSGTPTKRDLSLRRALDNAGIETVEISARALVQDGVGHLVDCLPSGDFTAFWTDEAMPSSPFKGSSLGEIITS